VDLEHEPSKQVWTVDFTQCQTAMGHKFHDFIIVIATKTELKIGEKILDLLVIPDEPESKSFDAPNRLDPNTRHKGTRRSKAEIQRSGIPGRPIIEPTLSQDIKTHPKQQKLKDFHFVIQRTKETPAKQTWPYVEWAFELLLDNGILDGFDKLKIWSDGCGMYT